MSTKENELYAGSACFGSTENSNAGKKKYGSLLLFIKQDKQTLDESCYDDHGTK